MEKFHEEGNGKPTDLDLFRATVGQLKREEAEGEKSVLWQDIDSAVLTEREEEIYKSVQRLEFAEVGVDAAMIAELENEIRRMNLSLLAEYNDGGKVDTVLASRKRFYDTMGSIISRVRLKHKIYD